MVWKAWRLLPRRFRAQKPEASGQKCPPPPKNVLTGEQFKTGARKDLLVGRPVTRMASFQLGGRVFLFGRTFCAIFSLFVLISRIAGSRCQATAMRRMSRTSELPQKRPPLLLTLHNVLQPAPLRFGQWQLDCRLKGHPSRLFGFRVNFQLPGPTLDCL